MLVQMLGTLSLTEGDVCAAERRNRSKEWTLIAYLLQNRHRSVSREELARVLVSSDPADLSSAIRKIVWRARNALEPLSAHLGTELILFQGGECSWNSSVELSVDVEEFEALLRSDPGPDRLRVLRQALALYRGDYLQRLGGESWVTPVATYYSNLYLDAVLEAVPLLREEEAFQEAAELCRSAAAMAPYDEYIYCELMRCLMLSGDNEAAAEVYRGMRDLFSSELGVAPGEEIRELFHEVLRRLDRSSLPLDEIRSQLQEKSRPTGARICDYETFQMFYQVEARSADRRGDAIHIGVLTLEAKKGKRLTEKAREKAMQQLGRQIQQTLRIGDVAASCSASQFLLLLVQANYENSQMVCQRVRNAFTAAHPSSPARIEIQVMPLEPSAADV